MIRPCFSTLACPDWTFEEVAAFAVQHGYAGVDARTAGTRGGDFTADPALTSGDKLKTLFRDAAISLACVSSSLTLDRPVFPPVVGRLLPSATDDVREGRSLVDVAVETGAELVRVYPFKLHGGRRRAGTLIRIAEQLYPICDHTRHKSVKVVIENAGDFPLAGDLLQIMDLVGHPNLLASYDASYAHSAGEDPVAGASLLGDKLALLRVKDADSNGQPVILGQGLLNVRETIRAASEASPDCWVSTTWERAWLPDLMSAEQAIANDAKTIYDSAGTNSSSSAA
ncbi:MAG: sugar phosphate isomerase/epimerase [Planctomycetota bacterium]